MFSIEMMPAGHGDSLILTYGDAASPHRLMIDGGPYYAFDEVSERIDVLATSKTKLDLLVVTHVDADHIDGSVKLLGAKSPDLVIEDIWFNAWEQLTPQPEDVLGAPTGEMLSALIKTNELPWNVPFGGGPVAVAEDGQLPVVQLEGGLTLTLLSPTVTNLVALRKVWAKALKKAGLEPGSSEQALAKLYDSARLRPPPDILGGDRPDIRSLSRSRFKSDTSKANASSIAFLAEHDGKGVLLAGDALPEVLESSIRQLLQDRGQRKLSIDALKLSHHGGKSNTSPELLALLECKHFLFSSNGNYYKHPHQETVARILVENESNVELQFNYRSEENRIWDDDYLKRRYRYETHYPDEEDGGLIMAF